MGSLIDSSIFVAIERGRADLEGKLSALADEVLLSAITASEILHGVHRATSALRRAKREATVEATLAAFPVLPFDLECARHHARVAADLAAQGASVGDHDLLIAATALAYRHRVVTLDVRSFPRIPGLEVDVW
jgi:predicted nucleic acid-binding protein